MGSYTVKIHVCTQWQDKSLIFPRHQVPYGVFILSLVLVLGSIWLNSHCEVKV